MISFTGNNRIEFIYDAMGAKLRKTTYANNTLQETRDYVNGVEYKNGAVDRFAHTEGAVVWQTNTFQHEYTIKDHLGNARVTYSDGNNDGIVTVADIKQINHYYPFGMNMEGNWNGAAGSNKYAYNGKEWNDDFGLGLNDYGARWYASDAPRWVNVDPLSELRADVSPYQYVQNNPINAIDPTGMLDESFYSMSNGKSVKQVGEDFQEAAQRGDFNKNNDTQKGSKLVPFGTRTYVNGKLVAETIEGYNIVEDCDCGCPGKPPCLSEKFKEEHPNRQPFGWFEWIWTGGNINGASYTKDGQLFGYAPQMGTPPIIGGPLKSGDKILKIGQYFFNPKYFHKFIKPGILAKATNYAHIVGDNPDIVIKGVKILLSGAKSGPFAGKTIETGLSILDFIL